MIRITLITVGTLKEDYWKRAVAEYEKRLSAFCKLEILQLKEERLGDSPSQGEINAALEEEGRRIRAAMPPRAHSIALCVEGKQFSSEDLAKRLDGMLGISGDLCFIIGSSHGLSPTVKNACELRLSVSELTFPHQMMRVILMEAIYRAFNIIKGTKYHK